MRKQTLLLSLILTGTSLGFSSTLWADENSLNPVAVDLFFEVSVSLGKDAAHCNTEGQLTSCYFQKWDQQSFRKISNQLDSYSAEIQKMTDLESLNQVLANLDQTQKIIQEWKSTQAQQINQVLDRLSSQTVDQILSLITQDPDQLKSVDFKHLGKLDLKTIDRLIYFSHQLEEDEDKKIRLELFKAVARNVDTHAELLLKLLEVSRLDASALSSSYNELLDNLESAGEPFSDTDAEELIYLISKSVRGNNVKEIVEYLSQPEALSSSLTKVQRNETIISGLMANKEFRSYPEFYISLFEGIKTQMSSVSSTVAERLEQINLTGHLYALVQADMTLSDVNFKEKVLKYILSYEGEHAQQAKESILGQIASFEKDPILQTYLVKESLKEKLTLNSSVNTEEKTSHLLALANDTQGLISRFAPLMEASQNLPEDQRMGIYRRIIQSSSMSPLFKPELLQAVSSLTENTNRLELLSLLAAWNSPAPQSNKFTNYVPKSN